MTSKKLNSKRWCEVPILPICTFVKCGSMQSSQWALIKSITAHLCENDGIVKARLCPISQPYWIRAAFWSQNSPRARIELSDWFTHVRNRVELWTSWAKWRWIPQIFIFFFLHHRFAARAAEHENIFHARTVLKSSLKKGEGERRISRQLIRQ